ncbi:MAG: ATP-dependent DNA helicase RecG [Planctomycetes bacterium]|nr:ATP-dependent DNA helicase RecG [Planctomycetota bacterium]
MTAPLPAHEQSLRFLRGIGPARATALAAMGLETVWDVLHAVPKLLGPPPMLYERGPMPPACEVRVRARVVSARPSFGRGRGMGVEAKLERADGMALAARFFNAGYLRRHLIPGEWFLWEGRTDDAKVGLLIHPSFVHLPGGAAQALPEEPPVRVAYRAPEGVSERTMRELAESCLEHLGSISDPAGEVDAASWQAAIRDLHRPPDAAAHATARRLLSARELLALAWRMQERRARQTGVAGRAWNWSDQVHERALARLPFILTDGQRQAVTEIRSDLQAPAPMYRLLNGDVGSGKTAVALLAMLAVVADGAQAVLLAPTAVLANQHAVFIQRCLAGSRVRTALLSGGTPTEERAATLTAAADGSLGILIGTHALLEDAVQLKALGLLVIDEQHKFGVEQRGALIARAETAQGWRPDLLLMTATPIPRTLALTAFGDLAVSRIAGRPPGRAPVTTSLGTFTALTQLDDPIRQALAANGQVFVICPLREASERVTAADAERVHAHLTAALAPLQIGLLYGAMAEAQKLALMGDFSAGRTRVLVSTTVVEVGIDVPAATLLIVLDAERFGLAQLHQLRGRLGRGDRPGHCLLFHRQDDLPERLRVLVDHDDGLAIAEADLATRGPGQLLGTGQHGSLALKVAELPRDLDLLQSAHQRARERIAAGDTLPPLLPRLLGGDEAVLAGG